MMMVTPTPTPMRLPPVMIRRRLPRRRQRRFRVVVSSLPPVFSFFLLLQVPAVLLVVAEAASPSPVLKTRIEKSENSQIIRIIVQDQQSSSSSSLSNPQSPQQEEQEDEEENDRSTSRRSSSIRLGRLLGLQGLTVPVKIPQEQQQEIGENGLPITTTIRSRSVDLLFNDIAVWLAFKQFNERRGDILPNLPSLIGDCDFHWTYQSRDTQRGPLAGTAQLIEAMTTTSPSSTSKPKSSSKTASTTDSTSSLTVVEQLEPFAYFGAHLSSVSKPLSTLGAAFDLPQISGASTSSELESSPFFARTISTNEADARAILVYFKHVVGVTHVANIYLHNQWGVFYNTALRKYAHEMDLHLLSFPLDNTPESIEDALEALKESQYRYVFAALNVAWPKTFETAYRKGLIGNDDYVWFAGEFSIRSADGYNRTDPHRQALAMALQGVGTINLYQEPFPAMDAAMTEMTTNTTLQEEYFSHIVEREEVLGVNFTLQTQPYRHAFRHYTNFDAVIAMGLAACNTPGLFTGKQLYRQLVRNTTFDGTSGRISFDPATGNRLATTVKFRIEYIQLSTNRSDDRYYRFDTHSVGIVRGDNFTMESPFVYHNNQTIPPPDLPPPQREDLNLIPKGVQWFGYLLAAAAIALSLMCLTWAIVYRGIYVVRAAQPIFLGMLCVGTIMIGSAIIPLSFPGSYSGHTSTQALDAACMMPIWLISLGFVIAFSSIHAKTWRMLKIMKSANQMIRTQVKPKDVILPFVILMMINLVLLVCTTLLAPFRFERIPTDSVDEFGRNNASFGTCRYFDNKDAAMFMIPLVIVDFLWLLLVLYMAYNARTLSTAFSESQYLVMTVVSLFETFLLGLPILVAVKDNPTAFFISISLMLAVSVAAILVPIFLPKYLHRKIERGRSAIQRTGHDGSGQVSARPLPGSGGGGGGSAFGSGGTSGLDPPPPTATQFSAMSTVPSELPSSSTSPAAPMHRMSSTFMQRISDLTHMSSGQSSAATKRRRSSAFTETSRPMNITSRDNSWHFEFSQGHNNNNSTSTATLTRKKNPARTSRNKNPVLRGSAEHRRQVEIAGIDKLELEALDLIRDLDLEENPCFGSSSSNHSHRTC